MHEDCEMREIRRHNIIRRAIQAADHIILDGAKTPVEIEYLTAAVTEAFLKKMMCSFIGKVNWEDIMQLHPTTTQES